MESVVFSIKRHGIKLPIYKKNGDAGFDLRCGYHFYLREGRNRVPNGICFNLPNNTEGQVRPRSGNSANGLPVVTIDQFFSKCGVSYFKWASTHNHKDMSIYDSIEEFVNAHDDVEFTEDELIRIDADVALGTVDSNYTGEVCTTVINRQKQRLSSHVTHEYHSSLSLPLFRRASWREILTRIPNVALMVSIPQDSCNYETVS